MKFNRSAGIVLLAAFFSCAAVAGASSTITQVAVGPQYDSFHVYVPPVDFDRLTTSLVATFGGYATKRGETTLTPTPSTTYYAAVITPVGLFSVFGFETPVPYPFGIERTGYLVSDIDQAIAQARINGAEVVVAPFADPIGKDAIIRWPGGVAMQLYVHNTAPHYAPLTSIPENRVYLSRESVDAFIKDFVQFSGGKVVADNTASTGAELSLPAGQAVRRTVITSTFGTLVVFVVDGHLLWPYGREQAGIGVPSVSATIARAKTAGAHLVIAPITANGRVSAMLQFPGNYIVEVHGAP